MAKKKEKCSLFEEMLMWTSYRYCIGRKSYINSMAGEMAQHYYNRLDDERMEFTAGDIRREIMDRLEFLPVQFRIHRLYESDQFNPIEVLMNFLERYKVDNYDEFIKYCKLEYDVHTDTYTFEKKEPTIKSHFSISDIDDLINWDELASCFDKKNHKMITVEYDGKKETHECFKSWVRKIKQADGLSGWYTTAEFGWEQVWVDIDNYIKRGEFHDYINEDYIIKIEDMKKGEE